ncbi:hypothetical protein KP509_28G006700 [Ceratopteris richardii]|uniref:C2 domain-containing protein n=1 Tax=Ceratopteris richardii TaxID=49495 RepID=A0A8T2RBE7_CERRI|nr:hypothetical protein KP509_28G006700 [Ceratopteris richardii]
MSPLTSLKSCALGGKMCKRPPASHFRRIKLVLLRHYEANFLFFCVTNQPRQMVEIRGVLKVRVIGAKGLVKRDVFSSDPYAKLDMGGHTVRTRAEKRTLNPKWDEELTLVTSDPLEPLKVSVYDKDIFSADDMMGEAEVELDSIVNAVKSGAHGSFQDGMVVLTIPPTMENGFTTPSTLTLKNGHIVQGLNLKLRNQGEIELELQWRPNVQ